MSEQAPEQVYKGRKIAVRPVRDSPQLFIDGRLIHTYFRPDSRVYVTNHLPYRTHGSLAELAKALIDNKRV
ncbi:MAG: hypothetical protein ACHQ2Y_06155 [Candidatus Lutacidiplasmatales archaeon]